MKRNTIHSVIALLATLCIPLVLASTLLSACAVEQGTVRGALRGPSMAATALAEVACAEVAERETDLWWDCYVAVETERCEREGWCD